MIGGHAWLPGGAWLWGGMHGWGACVVAGGHAWLPGGLWLWGGMHGWGACMVAGGHAWLPGCAWLSGACVVCQGGVHGLPGGMRGIRRDTVNERAVRILLECILVLNKVLCLSYIFFVSSKKSGSPIISLIWERMEKSDNKYFL